MIDFSIMQLFPDFLLADKNGFAMAKAIEKALQIMCDTVQTGVDTVQNVDKMPEWRLDEMAWELGCLYDYNASIDAKRKWIRDATPLFAAYGTPQAIYNFLEGFFDSVEVEENWQYGGDAFHFRVTVSGKWTDANETWARMAIAAAKNVRSVLDSLAVGTSTVIVVHGEGKVLAKFPYVMTGPDRLAGTWPQDHERKCCNRHKGCATLSVPLSACRNQAPGEHHWQGRFERRYCQPCRRGTCFPVSCGERKH